ncbi:MAG: DMT family transporter [Hyphomicrobiales bacterium]|nr:DMT family transporter [Hyphomicrobiales bacterium]
MLGGLLALCAAATFGLNNASARRGLVSGTVLQAVAISVPLGIPIFLIAALIAGSLGMAAGFSGLSLFYLSIAGIIHFVFSRYCSYRAVRAIGSNLAGPVQETSMLVSLTLAVLLLGEQLSVLKLCGIVLVMAGPALIASGGRAAVRRRAEQDAADDAAGRPTSRPRFSPAYAEGYLFAILSSLGYGCSPVLVRSAIENASIGASITAGLISHIAAALVVGAVLLVPGSWTNVRSLDRTTGKWFLIAGFLVSTSQMLRYMALSIAPVTVVSPIQRLSLVFRVTFAWILNREHEVFSRIMFAGTLLSLAGAFLLTIDSGFLIRLLGLSDAVAAVLTWRWP